MPRQAFLLLSLEGFSEEEVAFILNTDIPETRRLTDAAGREMAAEIAKRAHHEGVSLREAAIASGHLTAQQFDAWVVPADMVGKGK